MRSDQVVEAKDVLRAVMELRRKGIVACINELDAFEPALMDYCLEETTALHGILIQSPLQRRQVQQLDRRIQSLAFVLVAAMRSGYHRLWTPEQEEPGGESKAPDPKADPGGHS